MQKNILTTLLAALIASGAAANNVTAQISSLDLNIYGDDLSNSIRVERAPGSVRVIGLNGTRVNGQPSVTLSTGSLVNVTALMNGGNDSVTFAGLTAFGDLNMEGGLGNDLLTVGGVNFTGNVSMKGEEGNDRAVIRNSRTLGDILLDLGKGANTTLAQQASSNNFTVIGGELVDRFDLGSLNITGSLDVKSDKGADVINAAAIQAELSAEFNLDEGPDRLTASNIGVGLDFKVSSGAQNDTVILSGISALYNIGITLDDGNDMLRTSNVIAQGDAVAIGGSGVDTFNNFGFLGVIKTEIIEFEAGRR